VTLLGGEVALHVHYHRPTATSRYVALAYSAKAEIKALDVAALCVRAGTTALADSTPIVD
jgi:hypothetical protein